VALFAVLPARRAMVLGAILASVLLPPFGIDLPGLPAYDKFMAASAGILFGTLIFDMGRILSFRPRWFDLPILLFCLIPYASATSNGLTPYDGLSASFRQFVMWWLPYLIGRLYLTDAESFRDLATGVIVSAVCMIPFCLLEMRIGAQLQGRIYGTGVWEGTRDGGFRPKLFFQSGLALGLWMNTATLLAWWLWRSGVFRSLWGFPIGSVILPALATTSLLCRAKGALLLGIAGCFTLWFCQRFKSKWVLWALLAVAPTYHFVRITNLWSGQNFVNLIEICFGEERAKSFGIRLAEEKVLIVNGLKNPIFGSGGYARARIAEGIDDDTILLTTNEDGVKMVRFVDSLWSIIFGEVGFAGLTTMSITMILPVILSLGRIPVRHWDHPALAPVSGMAVVLSLFMIDGLSNAMLNPIYIMIAGGLGNFDPARIGSRASSRMATRARTVGGGRDEAEVGVATGSPVPGDDPAARYQSLGRAAKDRGRLDEAEAAWRHALDLLIEWLAVYPDHPELRRRWCDCANDLAWLLAGAADPVVRDPDGAVALAAKTVEMHPECGTYWNTLGAARYRAGDFRAAIADLGRATALSNGGTAFDHVYLAMAHARLGNSEDARRWYARATIEQERYPAGHAELHRLLIEAETLLPPAAAISH
jgi:hypothetical protein